MMVSRWRPIPGQEGSAVRRSAAPVSREQIVVNSAMIGVDGTSLRTASGDSIVLRGIGLGGSLNMENFIIGYPGTESQMREAVRKVLGQECYNRFFDRLVDVFYAQDDARYL